MKKFVSTLGLLGALAFNAAAIVSGPDDVVYGTITLGGTQILATDTNYSVNARLTPTGSKIASYAMGALPSAGNFYSLRIASETVGATISPNAVQAGALVYIDVDDQSGIRVQTSVRAGAPGSFTLLNFGASTTVTSSPGSVAVNILPAAAIAAGAQWQLDGGAPQASGTVLTNVSAGTNHVVHFIAATNWTAPADQTIVVVSGVKTSTSGIYFQQVAGLLLLTNGFGSIQHSKWLTPPLIGQTYKLTAVPNTKNVFVSWVGGTNQPYSVLSTSATYSFVMASNLVLEANFETNVYMQAKGTYRGLFEAVNTNNTRDQATSGAFVFNLSQSGVASGSLYFAAQTVPFSGKIGTDGSSTIVTRGNKSVPPINLSLQMDFDDSSITGTLSNSTILSYLVGAQDGFSAVNKATEYEGQYTFVIPGTTNSLLGPLGTGFGTIKVSSSGMITMSGSLADGTSINETAGLTADGLWPLYVRLYSGKGSLWGWISMINHGVAAPSTLSWINVTNSTKAAVLKGGFTNQTLAVNGGIYTQLILPGGLPTTLTETNTGFPLTVTNLSDSTVHLTLHTNKATGLISGKFSNPEDPIQIIKVNGVIVQGQTNAQGYFIANGTSGNYETGN